MTGAGRRAFLVGVVMALGVAACAHAADWPQFLGPQRDGVAHGAHGLARSWPEGGPKHLWQTPVGPGFSGVAIYGDSVLLLDREDNSRDVVRRIGLADGKDVWRFPYDAPGKLDHNGSRSTPATDGDLVFIHRHLRRLSTRSSSATAAPSGRRTC